MQTRLQKVLNASESSAFLLNSKIYFCVIF